MCVYLSESQYSWIYCLDYQFKRDNSVCISDNSEKDPSNARDSFSIIPVEQANHKLCVLVIYYDYISSNFLSWSCPIYQ